MAIQICAVTGNVKNLLGNNVQDVTVSAHTPTPFVHPDGPAVIAGVIASVITGASGVFTLNLIETETVGQRIAIVIDFYDGVSSRRKKTYSLVIPNQPSAAFTDLIIADAGTAGVARFPAANVTVIPSGNLMATNAQDAFDELQGDIDSLNGLQDGYIYIGDAGNLASEVLVSGDISLTNTGVASITAGAIVDADVNAAAAIARTKLASGTADHVVINSGTGVLSSEATLAKVRGGTGADNSSVTFPSTGVIVTEAGTETLTNKTLTAPVISTIVNTGTLTLPTSTDTLVGRDTTDTLTNKSMSGSSNTFTNLPNGATTATSANTPSTIVARDASGNFVASTITADLDKSGGTLSVGANASIVNIGQSSATVNILGTVINETATNLNVSDKLITINDGGGAGSGSGSGFEVEENNIATGYVKTSGDRNSWQFLAPNTAGVTTLTPGAGSDTVTLNAASQTLTNKTLTTPVISQISNTGTLTLPTSSDTLVGRATTDTLTNKSISGSTNTITNVSLTTGVTGTLPATNGGTAQSTYATGDLLYASAANTLSKRTIGSTSDVLTVVGGVPTWAAPSSSGSLTVTTKTTTYTATTTDGVILADTSGGAWTLSLYTAVGNTGRILYVKKTTSDFSALTIDPNGAETVDGDATTSLNTQWEEVTLVSDGSNWQILSRKIPSVWASYTPATSQGFGTLASISLWWRRVGDSLQIRGRYTTGTVTGSEARIALPGSQTIDSTKVPSLQLAGIQRRATTTATIVHVSITGGNTYINFAIGDGGNNPTSLQVGNSISGSTEVQLIYSDLIAINGWAG